MPSLPAWLCTCLALLLALSAASLTACALFLDRSRGRRRCPRYWYNMAGVPSLTCPECGRTARSEREFLRTHRRWRWVLVSLVLAPISWVSRNWPTICSRGWLYATPSTVLVLWPMDAEQWASRYAASAGVRAKVLWDDRFQAELADRVSQPTALSDWQLAMLAWRTRRGSCGDQASTDVYRVGDMAPVLRGTQHFPPGVYPCFGQEGDPWVDVERAEQISQLIQDLVGTESWLSNGGDTGWIAVVGANLVIHTTPDIHTQVADFLANLRASLATRADPTVLLPAGDQRLSSATAVLDHDLRTCLVTTPQQPIAISMLAQIIRQQTGIDVAVDPCVPVLLCPTSLEPALLSGPSWRCSIAVALDRLCSQLEGFEIAWTIENGHVLVTTLAQLPAHTLVAAYPIEEMTSPCRGLAAAGHSDRDLELERADAISRLHELIQESITPEEWRDNGGDVSTMTCFAGRFIVRAPVTTHLRIQRFLSTFRAAIAARSEPSLPLPPGAQRLSTGFLPSFLPTTSAR